MNMKKILIILTMACWVAGINRTATAQEAKVSADSIYYIVEEMPVYPGGEKALKTFITENIRYPKEAVTKRISGKVYVTFVIDENGKVVDAKIARGVDPLLDEEALRVIKSMPDWTPGTNKGVKVKVSFTMPVQFALN